MPVTIYVVLSWSIVLTQNNPGVSLGELQTPVYTCYRFAYPQAICRISLWRVQLYFIPVHCSSLPFLITSCWSPPFSHVCFHVTGICHSLPPPSSIQTSSLSHGMLSTALHAYKCKHIKCSAWENTCSICLTEFGLFCLTQWSLIFTHFPENATI